MHPRGSCKCLHCGDFFVPEMLIAGRAMAGAMEVLRPLLAETGVACVDYRTVTRHLPGFAKPAVRQQLSAACAARVITPRF